MLLCMVVQPPRLGVPRLTRSPIPQQQARVDRLPSGLPTFHAFAVNDPLIEPAIQRELAEALAVATSSGGGVSGSGARGTPTCTVALEFERGGHNIQKVHARQLGSMLREWIASCCR